MERQGVDLLDHGDFESGDLLNIEALLKQENLENAALAITEGTFRAFDIQKKDSLDKFLDFVAFKAKTGYTFIINLAYPTMRMHDRDLESKIIEMINVHLNPEIILTILKFFARNIHAPDSNLHIAYLIEDDSIIKSVYDTFQLFRKDIFIANSERRALNVKRIQQFPAATGYKASSPLDAAARLKYILEFIAIKKNVKHIYTASDILLMP